jgi:transcription elongation factor GreA
LFLILKEEIDMAQASYMTEEGLAKLKNELEQLAAVERPAISQQIAEARDKGDLSENAEYDAAKEAQGLLEMRIARMEDMVAKARIIDESKIDTSHVQILNKVKIKNVQNNQQVEYMLVSESEADVKTGKISVATPIAKGLLGKVVGDVVEIQVPSGVMSFEIMEISL